MKAIVAREFGPLEALDYADVPEPEAGPGQVVVEAEAIGVNYPDGLLVQGLYQMKPQTPFVPGMEVAGRVIAVGDGAKGVSVGNRVAAIGKLGCYGERVAVPAASCFAIADDMDAGEACALLVGYGTAHHALKQRANLQPDETLCVAGAAGLTGGAAIQIGKAMGARVIAVASSTAKQELARSAGADDVVGYDNLRDDLKRLTAGNGVDVAFDPVGGVVFETLARAMAWNGRLLIVGFASGTIPSLAANLPLVKGYSASGVFWGAFTEKEPEVFAANMRELFAWHRDGKIKPLIGGTFPLRDAAKVLDTVLSRGATGKLILLP
jgi:NADPH2:quinone reductase